MNKDDLIKLDELRIETLYDNTVIPVVVTLTGCVVLAFVLWDKENTLAVISWLTLLFTVTTIRYLINVRFHGSTKSHEDYADWLNIFFVGTICSGTVLGSTAFVFGVGNNIINAGLLTMFILVLVSGSIGIYSIFKRIYFGFTIPTIVPLIIYLLYQQNELMNKLCTVIIAFVVFIFVIQFHASKIINQLLLIKLNNKNLLDRYELDHDRIHDLAKLYNYTTRKLNNTQDELRLCQEKLNHQRR
jgi:hypothetical protein